MFLPASRDLKRLYFSGAKIKFHDHHFRTLKIFSLAISWPVQSWHKIAILRKLFHMEIVQNRKLKEISDWTAYDESLEGLGNKSQGEFCFELNVYIPRTYSRLFSSDRPKRVQLFVALISPVSI